MSNKIILTRGIQGSGKSTYAKEETKKNGNYYRLNRDDMRKMLFPGCKFSWDREKAVFPAELEMARSILTSNRSVVVIVDDTNLKENVVDKWRGLAAETLAKFQIKDFTHVPVEECIRRDIQRGLDGGHSVGPGVIYNTALDNGLILLNKPYAIFDMDGTLSDPGHRLHLIRDFGKDDDFDDSKPNFRPDWKAFLERCDEDPCREDIVEMLQAEKEAGHGIVIVSARGEEYSLKTYNWMKAYNIPFDYMFMRKANDFRQDDLVKSEILDKLLKIAPIESIVGVYDDRPQVIRMWESRGLPVHDVGSGVEF